MHLFKDVNGSPNLVFHRVTPYGASVMAKLKRTKTSASRLLERTRESPVQQMNGWKDAISTLHMVVNQEEGAQSTTMFSVGIITGDVYLVIWKMRAS